MSYYKFSEDDVFYNRVKTHPSCHFITYKGCTYYNKNYTLRGTLNDIVGHVSSSYTSSCHSGFVSVHEINVDRPENLHTFNTKYVAEGDWFTAYGTDGKYSGGKVDAAVNNISTMIYPFVTKDGTRNALRNITYDSYVDDFKKGEVLSGSYPLSASLTRIFYAQGSAENGNEVDPNGPGTDEDAIASDGKTYFYQTKEQTTVKIKNVDQPEKEDEKTDAPKLKKKYIQALENTIDYYKKWSPHYIYSSSFDPITGENYASTVSPANSSWNKSAQALSIIDVPTIFFGSSIKKGTVSLKYYITGTLIGELQDSKRNGELIQVGPSGSFKSGSVAGIILYNEGALILTGTWDLTSNAAFKGPHSQEAGAFGPAVTQDYRYYGSADKPSWVYFGTGMHDGSPSDYVARKGLYYDEASGYRAVNGAHFHSSSFELSLSGTNYVPTITMMAHAKRGYLNWSNNPTYIEHGQTTGSVSGSTFYKESDSVAIKNTISSSFQCHTASFKKQTFINKIGIYDKNKNLIAIAKVANPVRKLETDEYTFKLKLDI
jgi:hypothetical protein